MGEFYPSPTALDLTWQQLSIIAGGDEPTYRAFASLCAWGTTLLLFGGLAHHSGDVRRAPRRDSQPRSVHVPTAAARVQPPLLVAAPVWPCE
eukprot:294904-Prymnesium_polylepis.2